MASDNQNNDWSRWRETANNPWRSEEPGQTPYWPQERSAHQSQPKNTERKARYVNGQVVWSTQPANNPATTNSWRALQDREAQRQQELEEQARAAQQASYANPYTSSREARPTQSSAAIPPVNETGRQGRTGSWNAQGLAGAQDQQASTPRRRRSSRETVEYTLDSYAQAEEAQVQAERNAPSWYDATDGQSEVSPRSLLDPEFSGSPREARSQQNLRLSSSPNRPRIPIFKVIAALLVVALIAFAVTFLIGCSHQEETSKDETLEVADKEATSQEILVSFAGDCTLGTDENFSYEGGFNEMVKQQDSDWSYFLSNVKDIFDEDDLTVVNFEGTLTEETSRADKKFAFKGPAEYANILVEGGVEAASTANNHSHDYGTQAYDDTIENLKDAGIDPFGYDDIAYEDVNGVKVGLVGTYELAEGAGIKESMVANIEEAKKNADVVIVYIHWGIEREATPDETQVMLGHAAIDAGADAVIGSHPHVIQGYETYEGKYIVYSMGNFCFGGNMNPTDKDTWIVQLKFTVEGGEVTETEINPIPCSLSSTSSRNDYRPTPAKGDEKDRIQKKIDDRSEAIA